MTPYDGPSMPSMGNCPVCNLPVYRRFVVLPAGPTHADCARWMSRRETGGLAWEAAIGASIGVGGLLLVLTIERLMPSEERQATQPAAALAIPNVEQKERLAFLYCDGASQYCEAPERQTIHLYANEADFSARNGPKCRRRLGGCAAPSPSLTVAPGIKVVVLPEPSGFDGRTVRIDDGPNKGNVGLVHLKYIHDSPQR
jgi:hypothetical protein